MTDGCYGKKLIEFLKASTGRRHIITQAFDGLKQDIDQIDASPFLSNNLLRNFWDASEASLKHGEELNKHGSTK